MPDATLRLLGQGLAAAFLAGDWELRSMTRRGQRAVGRRRVWVRDLAAAACQAFAEAPRDRPRELAAFLTTCPPLIEAFARARSRPEPPPSVQRWFVAHTAMGAQRWDVAPLHTVGDLRELVGVTTAHLGWFADVKHLERHVADERLRHYRYRWAAKGRGGVRLIEEPKPILKHFQRVILREILTPIPAHPAAHGFRPGRSALSFASGHTRQAVVIHFDLEDFFGSVTASRVYGLLRACGYPEPVAHVLTAMVTNSIPPAVWARAPRPAADVAGAHHRLGRHLAHPHLPQGAPTSPALANLAAFGLDRRLSRLAAAAGLRYSRYADDLALSSPTRRTDRQVERTLGLVGRIVAEEGFRLNDTKTSVRRSGQHQRLAGIVVNERPNTDRREFERLEATLTNAARHGPGGQNHAGHPDFRAHLLGRINWTRHLNPRRGQRLLAVFEQIDWTGTAPSSP